ncbi:TMEM199/VMA12 family protein [Aspergillus ibericus CBS 121593]|uniref:Endoplasmic reticulum-based factor for assembly of V-ATPase n=1 Tax=Aspergillus ibericus CBS 121593 TaxID=1448316 RepID=A0A395GYM1_9EURO|nr:hypothetical protein BO80DRAFT_465151 [Aspergillus ibericus CBS 121593]RAL00677.1 hypothetical protein BO80DRAFT_465151 [Aspergillus ibericus CBS 121593]
MVLLITTPPILAAVEALPTSSRTDLALPDVLNLNDPISHAQLIQIARYFRAQTSNPDIAASRERSLDALLRGTKVYIPPPPKKPEPSPEYLALKARLLAAAETDAYNCMTSSSLTPFSTSSSKTPAPNSIFTSSTPTLSALHDKTNNLSDKGGEEDQLTPSLVLNIFLSVLITGFSVYWALSSFRTPEMLVDVVAGVWGGGGRGGGGKGVSEAVKVLVSLGVALGVGVTEVMIYAIYLRKIEVAKGRERRLKERKVVVGSERVGGTGGVGEGGERVGDDGEKEEIWGRGVNGGLRRRVRERWEEKERDLKTEIHD